MIDKQTLIDEEELNRYADSVAGFLGGKVDADRFQSMRLQQGIYGQRQQGVNMVRIKIPGGRMNPAQAQAIAVVVDQHSEHGTAHVTTRQSIQVHYIPLDQTPAATRQLATAGLTSREACNNTVRNMSACALAGVCPAEHVDITPFLEKAASHFLRHPLTQHLPRKFKISFSGCEQDCAQGMIHDLAVIAIRRHNRFGFKLLAGGGLGHKPREAIIVEEFIDEQDLLACMEAVISVHNRYSNRKLRAKSRIKFLVERFGPAGFIEKYREELSRTRTAVATIGTTAGQWHNDSRPVTVDAGAPRQVLAQKQSGLNIIPIQLPNGDITAAQLRGIAALMARIDVDDLRTSQDQNLLIVSVKDADIETVTTAIQRLGLDIPRRGNNIVACPGTSTCRLGITASTILAPKLSGGDSDLRLRVSGCHNGCAQPETGDIGIYGEGKRLYGKLIPHYQVYVGGDGRGSRGLAFKTRSIPSARIETAIKDIKDNYQDSKTSNESFYDWCQRQGSAYFDQLLAGHAMVGPNDIEALLRDHGDTDDFRVIQFGGGECAGAAQETVAANFSNAANERNYRDAFLSQGQHKKSLTCAEQALRLIGHSLLFLAAQSPVDDLKAIALEIKTMLNQGSARDQAISQTLAEFAQTLEALRSQFELSDYQQLIIAMDKWSQQAATLCQDIDQQLDLSAAEKKENSTIGDDNTATVDLSSYGCPLHYIKARSTLRQHQSGDVIEFLFASGDPARQASTSLAGDGHQVLEVREEGITTRVRICKAG